MSIVVCQVERLTEKLAVAVKECAAVKERCAATDSELRRVQSRRDMLTEENTTLGQKVRAWHLGTATVIDMPPPSNSLVSLARHCHSD